MLSIPRVAICSRFDAMDNRLTFGWGKGGRLRGTNYRMNHDDIPFEKDSYCIRSSNLRRGVARKQFWGLRFFVIFYIGFGLTFM